MEWETITIQVPKCPGVFDHQVSFWIPELPLGNKSDKSKLHTLEDGRSFAKHYKDPGSKAFQNRVRNYFHNEMYEQGKLLEYPFDGWCRAFIHLFYPKPAGWHPNMVPESSRIPDNDNVHKSIADGLNAARLVRLKKPDPTTGKRAKKITHFGPYDDDKQIVTSFISKSYSDWVGARVILWFYRRLPRESKRNQNKASSTLPPEPGEGPQRGFREANDPDQRSYRQLLDRFV